MAASEVSILVATSNPAKEERLRRCLAGWRFRFHGLKAFDHVQPPPEEGKTHRAIATGKARFWSRMAGGLAIASDGGLILPALGSRWSSLMTRRAAGKDARDDDRVRNLLELMAPYHGDARKALWAEAVAIAGQGSLIQVWEVEGPEGSIAEAPSPQRIEGFWAASLWYFPTMGKRYTELSSAELTAVGDPWVRLEAIVQKWLHEGGWQALVSGQHDALRH